MADIFISYAREDRPRVRPLVTALEARGWSVFWDAKLPAGSQVPEQIEGEIDAARCVVVVWTQSSVKSAYVSAEAHRAHDRRKLVPIQLDAMESFPIPFNVLQTADLSGWTGDVADSLFEALLQDVARKMDVQLPEPQTTGWRARFSVLIGRLRWLRYGLLASAIVSTAIVLLIVGATIAAGVRGKKIDEIDRIFADLQQPNQPALRVVALGQLETMEFTGGLEHYAVARMTKLLKEQHPRAGPCTADTGTARRVTAQRELDIVRKLRAQGPRTRRVGDRAYDWFLRFSPKLIDTSSFVSLDSTDLRGAKLNGLRLDSASFRHACLFAASFEGDTLTGANFASALLDDASFRGATGRDIHFERSSLRMADFTVARLHGARFNGAQLQCALFVDATLDSANFDLASLAWASFRGARFEGVSNWNTVTDFTGAQFGDSVAGATERNARAAEALAKDASRDTEPVTWVRARDRQRRPGGLCSSE